MKKDFLNIVAIPLTGLGLGKDGIQGYSGDSWFKYRIEIFKKYTLKSLLNQTNRDFILWIAVRPEERDNPICQEFKKYLETMPNFPVVFTYGGCYLWDDKFKNDNLLERFETILPQLKTSLCPWLNDIKYIYLTSHSSDDMLHKQAIEEIQKKEYGERRILNYDRGYVFNHKTQRLAIWNPTTIKAPFYTIMFLVDTFFDPQKHFNYMRNSKSHEDVIWIFNQVRMPNYRYCVLVHDTFQWNQISTNWYHAFRDEIFGWQYGKDIMEDFGIDVIPSILVNFGIAKTKMVLKRWIFRVFIKGRIYRILKKVKNKYEQFTLQRSRK